MKISSWRLILVVTTAVCLSGYPKPASATTVNVTVAPNGAFVFFALLDQRFAPVIRCDGTWGTISTALPQALRACPTVYGTLEFSSKALSSRTLLLLLGPFSITALRTAHAATW